MSEAAEIHGVVFKNGSATLLARVVGADGLPVTRSQITAARYTVALLDDGDPDAATPVEGHVSVPVQVAGLLFDSFQMDALWELDATGYNFRHVLGLDAGPPFPRAGRNYRVTFELDPASGPVVLVRFRVYAI